MISGLMVPADMAERPAADLGARTRLGPLPDHRTVIYVKDVAVTLVVLLALPYVIRRLLTRPSSVIGPKSLP